MYNRNLLRQSLRSSRWIRLPFDCAQGRLKRIHSELASLNLRFANVCAKLKKGHLFQYNTVDQSLFTVTER